MATANETIKKYAKSHGVCLWEVAEKLGIRDVQFSTKLRHELPSDEQEKIKAIIDEIAERN